MSAIFISHNSGDAREAVALKRWLADNGWNDVFLDIDAKDGLNPGERWKDALKTAADRCEAVLCLVSPAWLSSAECQLELRYAETLRKQVFLALIKPCEPKTLPPDWQWCPLYGDGAQATIRFEFREQSAECAFLANGLERLRNGLQKAGISAEYFPWPPENDPERAPYRGLKPLEAADAAVFFGRNPQILHGMEALWDMRRNGSDRLLVILGASGSGKSSFMRAGLLPRLTRDDRQFFPLPVIRPRNAVLFGAEGLAPAFAAGFARLDRKLTLADTEKLLHAGPVGLEALLTQLEQGLVSRNRAEPATAAPSIVIPIDQAEELFNPDGAAEAAPFLALLGDVLSDHDEAGAAAGAHRRALVVLTIRSDRYERLQTAPGLSAVKPRLFDLKPFPSGQFERVINGPAERATQAGRKLNIDSCLTERLLVDFAEGADTLPLLGFTLEKLYHRYGIDGDLTLEEYEDIRGHHETVQAAIFQEAIDSALTEPFRPPVIPADRSEQYRVLRRAFIPFLARINPENNEPMRQVAKLTDLPADIHPLVERLVDARLLLRDKDAIEVAHESLLRQWPSLRGWLTEDLDKLRLLGAIQHAAAEWKKENQREDMLLHRDGRLKDAETLLATPGYVVAADSDERAYLNACTAAQAERDAKEEARRQAELRQARQLAEEQRRAAEAQQRAAKTSRRFAYGAGLAFVVVAVLGLWAWQSKIEAQHQTRVALARQLAAQSAVDIGENPELGLLLAVQAHNLMPTTEGTDALLAALEKVRGVRAFLPDAPFSGALELSPDGTQVAVAQGCVGDTADGCQRSRIEVWRVAGPQRVGAVEVEQPEVRGLAFSDDGRRLAATACCVSQGEQERTRELIFELTEDAAATAGLRLVKTADRLSETGREPDPTELLAGPRAAAASREAIERVRRAVGAPDDVRDWSAAAVGTKPRVLASMHSSEQPARIELWDAGEHPQRLARAELKAPRSVRETAIRPDGKLAAAWGCASFADGDLCYDSELVVFDATGEGVQVGSADIEQTDGIRSLALMPRSAYVLSGGCGDYASTCNYGTVQLWRVDQSPDPDRMQAAKVQSARTFGGTVQSITLFSDARMMAVAGQDGRVTLYRLDRPLDGDTRWLASLLAAKLVTTEPGTRPALKCGDEAIENPVLLKAAALLQQPADLCPALKGLASGLVAVLSGTGTRLAISGCTAWQRDTDKCQASRTTVWSIVDRRLARPAVFETAAEVTSLAFAAEADRMAVASCPEHYLQACERNARLEVIDLTGERPSKRMLTEDLDGVTAMAFQPRAGLLAFATCAGFAEAGGVIRDCVSGALHFLDLASSSLKAPALTAHDGQVNDLAFNADGTLLVSGAADGSVALWDPAAPKRLGPVLAAHTDAIQMVHFASPEMFVTATANDEIEWSATPERWKDIACQIAGRNLTPDEWAQYMGDASPERTCPELPPPADIAGAETKEADRAPASAAPQQPAPLGSPPAPGVPESTPSEIAPPEAGPPQDLPEEPAQPAAGPTPEVGSGAAGERGAPGRVSPTEDELRPTSSKIPQPEGEVPAPPQAAGGTLKPPPAAQPPAQKAGRQPAPPKGPKVPKGADRGERKAPPRSPSGTRQTTPSPATPERSGNGVWKVTK